MKFQYDELVEVTDVSHRRFGQRGRVIESTEWTVTIAFQDRATILFGNAAVSKRERLAPVVG